MKRCFRICTNLCAACAFIIFAVMGSAQISVGPAGLAPQTFDSLPPATSWSFRSQGPSDSSGVTTAAALDAQVQTNAADIITNLVVGAVGNPPAASANALWASDGHYLLTRPTGNRFTLLMTTLRNDSGSNLQAINISYNLTNQLPI